MPFIQRELFNCMINPDLRKKIAQDWDITEEELNDIDRILFYEYSYENYSGNAMLVFEKDGKLYQTTGSHCSCNGLEGQFSPEETSVEELSNYKLKWYYDENDDELNHRLWQSLVFNRIERVLDEVDQPKEI